MMLDLIFPGEDVPKQIFDTNLLQIFQYPTMTVMELAWRRSREAPGDGVFSWGLLRIVFFE